MATLRNKLKLAAIARKIMEEHPGNSQLPRDAALPRINEDYIIQMSKEIEGRVTKKMSQELSRTMSRILGALSKLNEFRVKSRTVPRTSRNSNGETQEANGDRSQNDPHPKVGTSVNRSPQLTNSDPDKASYSYCRVFLPGDDLYHEKPAICIDFCQWNHSEEVNYQSSPQA